MFWNRATVRNTQTMVTNTQPTARLSATSSEMAREKARIIPARSRKPYSS